MRMQAAARTLVALVVVSHVAGCERADHAVPTEPPAPSVPIADLESLVPEPIIADRTHVERPPAPLPGAAWFHRLTAGEQANVNWVCRLEREDPCFGLLPRAGS